MTHRILPIADGFWNIRGSFKVGGVVDVGTHASLARLGSGKFVLLDSYTLSSEVEGEVRSLTNGGDDIEAILNVHPFHTIHVRWMHEHFPNAKLFGTARHLARFTDLPWEPLRVEEAALHEMFLDDLAFQVPVGVDFIPKNENIHFSSVLVLHRATQTIHVDDTLMYVRLPKIAKRLGRADVFSFHPTLSQALERRAGAADDFERWASSLAVEWGAAKNLCAAHSAALTADKNPGATIEERIVQALAKVRPTLGRHRRKYG
jgi:hypothetical protein